jgi:hypothetical protein
MQRRNKPTKLSQSLIVDCETKVRGYGRVTFGLDMNAKAGMFYPRAFVAWDRPYDNAAGWTRHSVRFTLPHLSWSTAYRFRRFGMLKAYRVIHAGYRFIVTH